MLQINEKGTYKVVDAGSLEMWTSMGWHLVAVLEHQDAMAYSDMVNHPNPAMPGYGSLTFSTASDMRYHDVKSCSFLLRLDEETVVGQLNREVNTLRESLARMQDLESAATALRKEVDSGKAELLKTLEKYEASLLARRSVDETLRQYKFEHGAKVKQADEIIERDAKRRRTAYERVAEGDFNDGVESVEERDLGG